MIEKKLIVITERKKDDDPENASDDSFAQLYHRQGETMRVLALDFRMLPMNRTDDWRVQRSPPTS